MTRAQLENICAAIRAMKEKTDRLESIHARVEALRDGAVLPTTRALYQSVLDMFDGSEAVM